MYLKEKKIIIRGIKDVKVKEIRIEMKEKKIEYELLINIIEVRCR
jgi:hypothetical protein